jgi:hypothetical protein
MPVSKKRKARVNFKEIFIGLVFQSSTIIKLVISTGAFRREGSSDIYIHHRRREDAFRSKYFRKSHRTFPVRLLSDLLKDNFLYGYISFISMEP